MNESTIHSLDFMMGDLVQLPSKQQRIELCLPAFARSATST